MHRMTIPGLVETAAHAPDASQLQSLRAAEEPAARVGEVGHARFPVPYTPAEDEVMVAVVPRAGRALDPCRWRGTARESFPRSRCQGMWTLVRLTSGRVRVR